MHENLIDNLWMDAKKTAQFQPYFDVSLVLCDIVRPGVGAGDLTWQEEEEERSKQQRTRTTN